MSTRFLIPRILQRYARGASELQLEGTTIRDLLDNLQRDYPALHQCLCDETGALRRHINLFVNDDFLHQRNVLHTALHPGDVVTVFQAVSGG